MKSKASDWDYVSQPTRVEEVLFFLPKGNL